MLPEYRCEVLSLDARAHCGQAEDDRDGEDPADGDEVDGQAEAAQGEGARDEVGGEQDPVR